MQWTPMLRSRWKNGQPHLPSIGYEGGRKMTEELAASVGKRIVFEVIRQFRADFIAK